MLKVNPFRLFEQFVQIANAGPAGVDAGDLVCKAHKEELFELGLVTPKYGTGFRLTTEGLGYGLNCDESSRTPTRG